MINYHEKQINDTLAHLKKYGYSWVTSFDIMQIVKKRCDKELNITKCNTTGQYYISLKEDQYKC